MKSFIEFLDLQEADPAMPNPTSSPPPGGGPPMGGIGGPPMGGMGGMGGPSMGGLGGPPMGGMGGMDGQQSPSQTPIELKNTDVWEMLDKLLNKSGNEKAKKLNSQSSNSAEKQEIPLQNDTPEFLQSTPGFDS